MELVVHDSGPGVDFGVNEILIRTKDAKAATGLVDNAMATIEPVLVETHHPELVT